MSLRSFLSHNLCLAILIALAAHGCFASAVTSAKLGVDGDSVTIADAVVYAVGWGFFYAEEQNRSSGIRVEWDDEVTRWQRVHVSGIISTLASGERTIFATEVTSLGDGAVGAVLLQMRDLGGGNLRYQPGPPPSGQMGVTGGVGLNNIGLYVQVVGAVDYVYCPVHPYEEPWIRIKQSGTGTIRVELPIGTVLPAKDSIVAVSGACSCERTAGTVHPCLIVSSPGDLVVLKAGELTYNIPLVSIPAGPFQMGNGGGEPEFYAPESINLRGYESAGWQKAPIRAQSHIVYVDTDGTLSVSNSRNYTTVVQRLAADYAACPNAIRIIAHPSVTRDGVPYCCVEDVVALVNGKYVDGIELGRYTSGDAWGTPVQKWDYALACLDDQGTTCNKIVYGVWADDSHKHTDRGASVVGYNLIWIPKVGARPGWEAYVDRRVAFRDSFRCGKIIACGPGTDVTDPTYFLEPDSLRVQASVYRTIGAPYVPNSVYWRFIGCNPNDPNSNGGFELLKVPATLGTLNEARYWFTSNGQANGTPLTTEQRRNIRYIRVEVVYKYVSPFWGVWTAYLQPVRIKADGQWWDGPYHQPQAPWSAECKRAIYWDLGDFGRYHGMWHCHSTASDGTEIPAEVRRFYEADAHFTDPVGDVAGVCVALTDHDCFAPQGHWPEIRAAEAPQHFVYLGDYSIGEYAVTRKQYHDFMDAGGYNEPSFWSADGWSWRQSNNVTAPAYWDARQWWLWAPGSFSQTDDSPVVGVSYYEAEAFCRWAGARLPTEAEWECAARWDGHPRIWPWGDTWDANKCNNWFDSLYLGARTSPVGAYPGGVSYSGSMDMGGNVLEWCRDWYSSTYYSETPPGGWVNPTGPWWGSYRVVRGSSWWGNADYVRCSNRLCLSPTVQRPDVGFRVAR